MKAVDSDPAGKMKQMLQDTVPVTAFVPVDSVSGKAGQDTAAPGPISPAKMAAAAAPVARALAARAVAEAATSDSSSNLSLKSRIHHYLS